MRTLMRWALAAVLCLGVGLLTARAETKEKAAKENGGVEKGATGVFTGKIVKKDGGKITVEGEQGRVTFFPYWRGGMPKDGGGFDKDMLRQREKFKVGDRVKIAWTMQEHQRIDSIQAVE